MATVTKSEPASDHVEEYVTGTEEVHTVSTGDSRTFAVTDRRVLDIRETEAASGRDIEEVESTLFSDVAKVDVSIHGSTTRTETGKMVIGILLSLVGVVLAGVGFGGPLPTGPAVGIGVVVLLLGVWLLMTATERVPGGVSVKLRHKTPDSSVTDEYVLPEDQDGAARAVVRALGETHEP
jgi:hypothetical protein